ncbi:MAG: TonB-dependent receptor [Pseudohongiellaceae bacterium]|nr:TonB-dependent receptor [Pseudohongiellaceae bacterium]
MKAVWPVRVLPILPTIIVLGFSAPTVMAAEVLDEIQVVGVTPNSSLGIDESQLPFAVQSVSAKELTDSITLDLSDYMNSHFSGVNINSAQNNPLQPDIQFRGFSVSPLLGLSQGLAVYQDGVRVNEPLGDAVNWDLLPESAVQSMSLISGASPLFGLNTLGGALSINMKNGFTSTDERLDVSAGSWGRIVSSIESGGNNGRWGYYLNLSRFEEDGWRDLSDSEAMNLYSSISWRSDYGSALDLIYQQGDSDLTGNGSLPLGLLQLDRSAVFTAPDITENDMQMLNLKSSLRLSESIAVSSVAFRRENTTDSFNGDGSEFESCQYFGGQQSLFEEADDVEDRLADQLGIALDSICEGNDDSVTSFAELEFLIEQRANGLGLEAEDFELEDIIEELSGDGVISDDAINNISRRKQRSEGFSTQLEVSDRLIGLPNEFVLGVAYFRGVSDFEAIMELSDLDPQTRSTEGLGTGLFVDEAETNIATSTKTYSIYFTDTIQVSNALSVTASARFNRTDIVLRDRSGERPELNGNHRFSRLNPALGFSYDVSESASVYGAYSESNRVPTPIELACNEGVFEVARQYAIANGDDPDDIDFECRLPNAFLADPPLDDVVTQSVEFGIRGDWAMGDYRISVFNAVNRDDILFQTTGRATGLFANVEKTRRRGLESALSGRYKRLHWSASYSYLQASFEDDFLILSPNHPSANTEGELLVTAGKRLPGLPEHVAKMSVSLDLSQAMSLGAEIVYNSSQIIRGDESNELDSVNGFTVLNLRAQYSPSEEFQIFARVTNALNVRYENFGLLGESPREVLPNLGDMRPIFLGAGAPRGGWLGFSYQF